jgi:hypothetical protein
MDDPGFSSALQALLAAPSSCRLRTVRVLTHIKKLDDCFGRFLERVRCPCGASRHIEPEALARLSVTHITLWQTLSSRVSQLKQRPVILGLRH